MGKKAIIEKSLVDQISDGLFTRIEKQKEFDAVVMQKLRELAATGSLTKPRRIIEAIKIMLVDKS